MRRSRRTQGGDDGEVDMTPMLDIVFIMLIFFIVTATFLDETGVDITQPPASDNTPPDSKPNPAIQVYVDARDNCSVDGKATVCEDVILDVETLLSQKPNAAIILRMAYEAKHNNLIKLKDEFDSAGLKSKIEILPKQVG